MGRLSAYAKNQILRLRFQKHNKITQIVKILTKEDIKISRQSVSTFLKKYLETDSILDKPRSGRKKKLTNEEIQQIGELTRSDPNITARSIKDKLGLTVSTYTILRASKLFEWNKINPNSNEAKKAAALERELRGERRRKTYPKKSKKLHTSSGSNETINYLNQSTSSVELVAPTALQIISLNQQTDQNETQQQTANEIITISTVNSNNINNENLDDIYDLKLINEREIISLKNTACSPMSFATKVLFRIFSLDELHGHNVSGKTFHKHISHKEPLEEKRLMYIRWLVEKYFYYPFLASLSNSNGSNNSYLNDVNVYYYKNKDVLWKACCNAINKMIRRSEVNHLKAQEKGIGMPDNEHYSLALNNQENFVNEQQQQQGQGHIVVQLINGVATSSNGNNTNLSKFSQLTQYLNDDKNNNNAIDTSFIDEIELISHKRQLYQSKIEVEEDDEDDDDDDNDSEIELLNENKLIMNITNQKILIQNNNNNNNNETSLDNSNIIVNNNNNKIDENESSQQQQQNENKIKRKITQAPVVHNTVAAAAAELPTKRSARIASKKQQVIETSISKKPAYSRKQTTSKKIIGTIKQQPQQKRKSNYYYESDDDDDDDDEEEDDDDDDDEDDDSDEDIETDDDEDDDIETDDEEMDTVAN